LAPLYSSSGDACHDFPMCQKRTLFSRRRHGEYLPSFGPR
jgi:hypothetical protein